VVTGKTKTKEVGMEHGTSAAVTVVSASGSYCTRSSGFLFNDISCDTVR
jgi:hypothetical protein